jgi:hypothetical protein
MSASYIPAWLTVPRPRRRSIKEIAKMLTPKKKQRPDPATVAANFRGKLTQLVDLALGDGAKSYFLIEALDAQLTRLRMQEAARPW